MRAVLSWVALGIDLDIYSVQYTKTTKAICQCYYGYSTSCTYSKLKITNDVVSSSFLLLYKVVLNQRCPTHSPHVANGCFIVMNDFVS